MAKPILIIRVPLRINKETAEHIVKSIIIQTENEYHVICTIESCETPSFECHNDCKGLADVDIEKLIKEINV